VTPQGSIACHCCYRLTQPNCRHGRKTIGHYPELAPSAAREPAEKRAATLERSRDDAITGLAKRAARNENGRRARLVPTVE